MAEIYSASIVPKVEINIGVRNALTYDGKIYIDVYPPDKNNQTGGDTILDRLYPAGTEVTITAPNQYRGYKFLRWEIDIEGEGVTHYSQHTITLVMNSNTRLRAQYSGASITVWVDLNPGIIGNTKEHTSLIEQVSLFPGIIGKTDTKTPLTESVELLIGITGPSIESSITQSVELTITG